MKTVQSKGMILKVGNRVSINGLLVFYFLSLVILGTIEDIKYNVIFILAGTIITLLVALYLERAFSRTLLPFAAFLLFVFAWSVFTSLFSGEWIGDSLRRVIMIFFVVISIVLLISSAKDTGKLFDLFLLWFIRFSFVLSILGIFLYLFGEIKFVDGLSYQVYNIGPFEIAQRVMGQLPFRRISSLTTNPNMFGIIAGFSLISVFYSNKNRASRKAVNFVFLVVFLIGLFLSGSRSAIIATGLMFLLNTILDVRYRLDSFLKSIFLLFILLLVLYLFVDLSTWLRVEKGLSRRDEIWDVLLLGIVNKPFLGVGFGISGESLLFNAIDISSSHSFYLMLMSEIGVLASGLIFFYFLTVIFKWFSLTVKEVGFSRHRFVGLMVLYFLLVNFVEGQIFRFNYGCFLFFFLFSLLLRFEGERKALLKP